MNCKYADESRPAIVFDLDDTLVISSVLRVNDSDEWIRVGKRRVYIRTRPGLKDMLKTASSYFDVYFFTAGLREYGNAVIDMIAPDTPAHRRFFREHCVSHCGCMTKDLSLIKRPMEHILLVDDMEGSALLQPENLVRISPWLGDISDRVMEEELTPLIETISTECDLRQAVRSYLKEEKLVSIVSLFC